MGGKEERREKGRKEVPFNPKLELLHRLGLFKTWRWREGRDEADVSVLV
jgi:hypothetical protein